MLDEKRASCSADHAAHPRAHFVCARLAGSSLATERGVCARGMILKASFHPAALQARARAWRLFNQRRTRNGRQSSQCSAGLGVIQFQGFSRQRC